MIQPTAMDNVLGLSVGVILLIASLFLADFAMLVIEKGPSLLGLLLLRFCGWRAR